MSEVNGKTLSIYFRIDEGVIEHNNRIFIANNVDSERGQDNIRAYSVSCSTISIIACIRITTYKQTQSLIADCACFNFAGFSTKCAILSS